jgi:putative transposase
MSKTEQGDQKGELYFFTLSALGKQPLFSERRVRDALRGAIHEVRQELPFAIKAWVLIPDHLHCIWSLPAGDHEFQLRWAQVKARTAHALRNDGEGEPSIWSPHYWDHAIRDEEDFRLHLDYVHWNPVKHNLVKRAIDWPYSTLHRYVERGTYTPDWQAPLARFATGDFGE